MAENTAQAPAEKAHGFRRKMVGKIIKDKMNKTVVVECVSARKDPLYGKYVRSRTRYKAHDEKNEAKTGDTVRIVSCRPLSRDKRWMLQAVVEKAIGV